MKPKKTVIMSCDICHEEDVIDIFSKLCARCQGQNVELDDESEDEDW